MVRVHLRKVHRVVVASGNRRMGRPRGVGSEGGAGANGERKDRKRLKRLIRQCKVNGVTGEMGRWRGRLIQDSGLSNPSKAETVVYALEPVRRILPDFESELFTQSRLVMENAEESTEIGVVELSWSPVAEYVAAAWAYADLKSAQASAGWLPLSVDSGDLMVTSLALKFSVLVQEGFNLCVGRRVVEPHPTSDSTSDEYYTDNEEMADNGIAAPVAATVPSRPTRHGLVPTAADVAANSASGPTFRLPGWPFSTGAGSRSGATTVPVDSTKKSRAKLPATETFTREDPSLFPQFLGKLQAKLETDAASIGDEKDLVWYGSGRISGKAAARIFPWTLAFKNSATFTIENFCKQLRIAFEDPALKDKALNG
ncbi:hypothetical protein V1525DRAFT_422246 [Lipomyces kononenkoae]|uniref:Uncharacterized protein n=1 Tax=Lipomyces kononenkoae TaxID=34357 RepID=A0ACC3SS45_LIPKO